MINKKSGITMTVLAISIAIMLLLMTSSAIIGSGYIDDAKFDGYKTKVQAVADNVNLYYLASGKLPITNESIVYTNYTTDFAEEVESKGDAKNKLFVVDVSKLSNYTLEEGKGTIENNDVFLVAENTGNVYYLRGFKYKGKIYYGI